MAIRNLLLMSVALVSLAACSSDEDAAVDTSMAGMNAGQLAGTDMGNGTAAPVNGVTPGTQQDLVVNVGDRVFFGYDQSDISAEGKATLDRQAAWLKQYPNVSVTIEGHADERGTREYNLALGERRAKAVARFLEMQGISGSRLIVVSYGKEQPIDSASNEQAWALNRRAEISYENNQ